MEPFLASSKRTTLLIALVAFLIGFGVSWLIFGAQNPDTPREGESGVRDDEGRDAGTDTEAGDDETATSSVETSSEPNVSGEGYAILVNDQPAGPVVFVDRVVLADQSWIVVYEERRGRPGNILGAARLNAGTHTDAPVTLKRGTVPGGIYYAMIHLNTLDDEFNFLEDVPLVDADGNRIEVRFQADPVL